MAEDNKQQSVNINSPLDVIVKEVKQEDKLYRFPQSDVLFLSAMYDKALFQDLVY
jgi:hypothetical protein